MKLKGKSALITGAGSGIGKSMALAFAREGAYVAIADVNLGAAQFVSDQIVWRQGQRHPDGCNKRRGGQCRNRTTRAEIRSVGRVGQQRVAE